MGIGTFHTLLKSEVHLSSCENCPSEEEVLKTIPTEKTVYEDYKLRRETLSMNVLVV